MNGSATLGVGWRVLRAEGPRAAAARALDRLADRRRGRAFALAPPTWRPRERVPVLNLLPMPPARRLGGVPMQLLARLAAEEAHRPVALLAPHRDGWRLEVAAAGERRAVALPGPSLSPIALAEPAIADLVQQAMERTGSELLHVEGLANVPLAALLALRPRLPRLVLSLHDFAAFCPRPHLLERPAERFCHYCRDLDRCGRCLASDWPLDGGWQGQRRQLAGRLLQAADALVFPSRFLADTYRALFPELAEAAAETISGAGRGTAVATAGYDPPRIVVVPPAPWLPPVLPPAPPQRRVRHLAYVGSVKPHKGAAVLAEVIERLATMGTGTEPRWTIYGGGDAALLARLRSLPGVQVRGYYRAGTLPGLLSRDGVDLALLLSTWPETHSFTLDECRAAGVPALAFDHGALGERLRDGGGILVPPEAGAAGVAAALGELLLDGRAAPAVPEDLRSELHGRATAAAETHLALYEAMASSISSPFR
jgi:glycosyltransferase involved in cell wall biosynthesis